MPASECCSIENVHPSHPANVQDAWLKSVENALLSAKKTIELVDLEATGVVVPSCLQRRILSALTEIEAIKPI